LRQAYKTLYRSGLTLQQAREALSEQVRTLQSTEAPQAGASSPSSEGLAAEALAGLDPAQAVGVLVEFLARVERGIVR
jgi:hypothetical protein